MNTTLLGGPVPNGTLHVHLRSYGLTMAAACTCPLSPQTVECPIPHFSIQKGLWPLCALDLHFCRARTGASSAADFYPTVKAALRHESTDSEEDREGLGCHLGRGRKSCCELCSSSCLMGVRVKVQYCHLEVNQVLALEYLHDIIRALFI